MSSNPAPIDESPELAALREVALQLSRIADILAAATGVRFCPPEITEQNDDHANAPDGGTAC